MKTLILLLTLLPVIAGTASRDIYFEYSSKGTYSRTIIEVKILPDRKIKYKQVHIHPGYISEEWTGEISESDYNIFIDEIMNKCDFMNLPSAVDNKFLTKDSSTDVFMVTDGDRKHSIGGYDAVHFKEYSEVYKSFRKVMGSVVNKKYTVKPGKR